MVTFRRITDADVPQVAAFATAGMPLEHHPGLRVSAEKVRAVVAHFARSAGDFHMVAFDRASGCVVGVLAAAVQEMPFFERCEAVVVACQARGGPPGVGSTLIRMLKDWADADLRVRRVLFPEDIGARRGFARLLARHGFNKTQRVLLYSKG